jgi:hypothetical protein
MSVTPFVLYESNLSTGTGRCQPGFLICKNAKINSPILNNKSNKPFIYNGFMQRKLKNGTVYKKIRLCYI